MSLNFSELSSSEEGEHFPKPPVEIQQRDGRNSMPSRQKEFRSSDAKDPQAPYFETDESSPMLSPRPTPSFRKQQ